MFVMLELRGILGDLWSFCILGDIIYRFDKQSGLKRLKIGFFKIGGTKYVMGVLVCDMYPELRNRVHVMVGVCVSVLSDAYVSRAWGNFNSVLRKTVSPFQCCCVYNFL